MGKSEDAEIKKQYQGNLTKEERIALAEKKIKEKRAQREAESKVNAHEMEINRIKNTKMMQAAAREHKEKEAEIDRAYAEQLEVAERRRNPAAYARKLARTEVNRRKSSEEFAERFAWQKSKDPLAEFKKRLASGKSELSPLIVTARKQTFPSSRFCLCPRSQKAWVRRRAQGGHPNAHGELWSWR